MIDRTGQQLESYHLLKRLGGGAFGDVYLAEDHRKRLVAIKILHGDFNAQQLQVFLREARIMRLRHEHIVSVLDFGVEPSNSTPYIVMDYAAEGTLLSRHPRGSRLPLSTIIPYVKQIAAALHEAHEEGIIHRDVKPENILLDQNSSIKLADFGIAVISQSARTSLESPQGKAGTPWYMAPEQIQGKPSRASDQYALATIVYEWLTGEPPFIGGIWEVYGQHLHAIPDPLPNDIKDLTPELEAVLMKALAKNSKDRYPNILAFANALEQASKQTISIGTTLAIYSGHTGSVWSVAWSLDGRRLASASGDKTVQVWDAATGKQLLTCTGHTNYVYSVAWSPDGSRLASASYDKTVRVWDAATGKQLLTCTGHTSYVRSVAWSPDGSRLASASFDETVRVWDAATGKQLLTCTGHTSYVLSVAWSLDGSRLASASFDVTVRVWDAATGKQLLTCTGHTSYMLSVAWSPDGSRLASASGDKTVQVWDAATGKHLLTYTGHTRYLLSVAWSPDGSRLASASQDRMVRVWDAMTGQCLYVYKEHSSQVNIAAWSPDGTRIASGGVDMAVRVWQAG